MPPLALSLNDLVPFADLGTSVAREGQRFMLKRNEHQINVEARDGGYFITDSSGCVQRYSNASALLGRRLIIA
jgi:hypothetical protein